MKVIACSYDNTSDMICMVVAQIVLDISLFCILIQRYELLSSHCITDGNCHKGEGLKNRGECGGGGFERQAIFPLKKKEENMDKNTQTVIRFTFKIFFFIFFNFWMGGPFSA